MHFLIKNACTLDASGNRVPVFVLTDGKTIAKVSKVSFEASAQEIDLSGCTLLPGFIHTHVHIMDCHQGFDNEKLSCSTLLADQLIQKGAKWEFLADDTRKIEVDSAIEAFENWHVDSIIEIDGLCVASLGSIRKQKVNLNREKDWVDIRLIDEFMDVK